jgi:hypothetical protein
MQKNIISACDDKERYSRSGHHINLVLKNTFKNNDKEIVKINENIEKLKTFVTLMKRKSLMRKFSQNSKAIPQEVETRFNSIYRMLKVFIEVYNDLKIFIVIDKDLQTKLLMIDEVIKVTKILQIFDKSTLILSENSSPTIQLVIQIKRKIISKLKIDEQDSYSIKALKQILKSNVEKYMKTHLIHNLALFSIQNVNI